MALPIAAAVIAAGGALALYRPLVRVALLVQIAGASLLAVGALAILASGEALGATFHGAVGLRLGVDPLSAFFIAVIALIAVPALLYSSDSIPPNRHGRALAVLTSAFVLALVGVLAARDAISFLACWELMTLIPAAAILVARGDAEARRAVFVYIAITHVAGAGVWVAILLLAHNDALGGVLAPSSTQNIVIAAALVGFGAKAGLMPLHVWLARAHPLAPAHISALMSGVMIKVAIYGLVRVLFEWTAPAPSWVGYVVLAVGALTAVGGVLYALVQRELKRLLAFSSIENIGIVALGLGASLVLSVEGASLWAAIAFGASLLHIANHAAFKSLLFLGAGSFGHTVGELNLDRLGGLLRRMPGTGWPFLIGCAAIAGLPPLNGFASEWLTLQSLIHLGFDDGAGTSLAGTLATAAMAMAVALSLYCFVKVAGLVLLGEPRTPTAAAAEEQPLRRRASLALLAGACVVLGAVPALLLPTLVSLAPGNQTLPTTLGMKLPGTGGLPSLALLIVLCVLAGIVFRVTARARRNARAPVWVCGQTPDRKFDWTSAGFTKPLVLALESVLRPRRELETVERPGLTREVRFGSEAPNLFDTHVYRPVQRAALRAAALARRTQSGNLRAYIAYLLVLVIGMLAIVRLGVIG